MLCGRFDVENALVDAAAVVLCTCPDESVRNGAEAIVIIEPLVRQTRRKEPALLDTLAAALAETGRFAEAVAAMDEALALLPADAAPERRAGYRARRDHFARERAWRDRS